MTSSRSVVKEVTSISNMYTTHIYIIQLYIYTCARIYTCLYIYIYITFLTWSLKAAQVPVLETAKTLHNVWIGPRLSAARIVIPE
jgi:hypothetical protein